MSWPPTFPTAPEGAPCATFVPGMQTLLYEDRRGVIRRLSVDTDDAASRARSLLVRGSTPEECARYFPAEDCPTFEPDHTG